MQKPFLLKNSRGIIKPVDGGGGWRGVQNFINVISPEMNVIERLEFKLAYNNVAVRYFSHYSTWTPSQIDRDDQTMIDGYEHPIDR